MSAMDITLKPVTIRDVVAGYEDNGQGGVVALGGKLNVRPAYQRVCRPPKNKHAHHQ